MYAAHELGDGFLFSYSDIVFAKEHARRAAEAPGAVALVIDRRWRDAYVGRALHPVSEAELARVEDTPDGPRVTRVGKRLVAAEDAAGEFIGLARFSPEGAAALARRLARRARARPRDALRRRGDAAQRLPQRRAQRARRARRAARARSSSTAAGARSTPRKTSRARTPLVDTWD